jgi:hypothetical protein
MLSRRALPRRRHHLLGMAGILLAWSAGSCTLAEVGAPVAEEFVRVSMRLSFLQRTWNREVLERDPVSTQVGDAQVRGHQTTSVQVRLSASPGGRIAKLHLHGMGNVRSNTVGVTRQARVNSLGNHTFEVVKPVYFDGRQFLTRSAHGQVIARTEPIAISTRLSGVPLLGALGERIAWSETYRRQPRTNSIVARQVADDVLPEFNSKIDRELAEVNARLADTRRQIAQFLPGREIDWQADSTNDGITIRAGFNPAPGTYRAARPMLHTVMKPDPQFREDLVVSVSDVLVNELFRRVPLNGLTISDAALQELQGIEPDRLMVGGQLKIPSALQNAMAAPAILFSLQLAEDIPLEVRFQRASVAVVLRFRILPRIGDPSDIHRLTLMLQGADGGQGRFAVRIADVEVASENSAASESEITQIIRTQSRDLLLDQPPTLVPRLASLQQETGLADLKLRGIRTRDGVLRASFEMVPESVNDAGFEHAHR